MKHSWRFYLLVGLVDFAAIFLLDWLIEGKYTNWLLVHDLIIAVVFTVIFWLLEQKPFKKNK